MTHANWRAWFQWLSRRRPARRVGRRVRPCLEPLEDRTVPATLLVNSLLDVSNTGVLTLRDAILVENGALFLPYLAPSEQHQVSGPLHAAGGDTISFTPDLAGQTITLTAFDDNTFGPAAFLINSQVSIVGDGLHGITIARLDSSAPRPSACSPSQPPAT